MVSRYRIGVLVFAVATASPATAQLWECTPSEVFSIQKPGSLFGSALANVGDVDGDGTNDIAIGAPGFRNLNPNQGTGHGAGRLFVYSGATGGVLFTFTGDTYDHVGADVTGLGDINGDGFADLLVGAPRSSGPGHAYILLGPDGQLGATLAGHNSTDRFGQSVDAAGDVDGDGIIDVIIGATRYREASPGPVTGGAFVYSGADGSELLAVSGFTSYAAFGAAVAGIGDRDGDGHADFIVGDSGHGRGQAYVYSGIDGSLVATLESDDDALIYGNDVGPCGDVNGDGHDDFFVTDPFSIAPLGLATGRVFVYSGLDLSLLLVAAGETVGEQFGTAVCGLGDWDGDGLDDLLVSARLHGNGAGRVEVRSGLDGHTLARFTGNHANLGGHELGSAVASMGDMDGDGSPELLFGEPRHSFSSGIAYLVPGSPRPPANYCEGLANSIGAGARMSYSQSTGVQRNEFTIQVDDAPPGAVGLFFYGAAAQQIPFGSGLSCVSGPRYRINPVGPATDTGTRTIQLDFTATDLGTGPGRIVSGSTWFFQFIYRDAQGPGVASFNLSDGLKVTFCD